jgi:hypothetical protein
MLDEMFWRSLSLERGSEADVLRRLLRRVLVA